MQYAFGKGYIHDDLQSELESWRKNYVNASAADDQNRIMETRTIMLRNEIDRLQSNVKVCQYFSRQIIKVNTCIVQTRLADINYLLQIINYISLRI